MALAPIARRPIKRSESLLLAASITACAAASGESRRTPSSYPGLPRRETEQTFFIRNFLQQIAPLSPTSYRRQPRPIARPDAIAMCMPKTTKPVSKERLAAGVPSGPANAQNSTGPRTPEGKTRSSRNSRKHGFAAAKFAVVRLEELDSLENLAPTPSPPTGPLTPRSCSRSSASPSPSNRFSVAPNSKPASTPPP